MKLSPTASQHLATAREIARVRQQLILRAREDPAVFVAMVLKDEITHEPLAMSWDPPHSEWQQFVSDYNRVIIWACPGAGKSQAIAIGRTLWELGRNHDERFVIGSATFDLAVKTVKTIKQYIECSEILHEIFPDLRPGSPWGSTEMSVQRYDGIRDPSVTAAGVGTNIHGVRAGALGTRDQLAPIDFPLPSLQ